MILALLASLCIATTAFGQPIPAPGAGRFFHGCYPGGVTGEEDENVSFRDKFDPVYPRIVKLAPDTPIMIAEFGCTAGYPHVRAEDWAKAALGDILSDRWPNVRGFSWWNERWENDDVPAHNTTMRVQDTPALGNAFREALKEHESDFANIKKK